MKQQILNFWEWFSKNEKRFWNYNKTNSHDFLTEIQEKLSFASDSDEYGIALEFCEISTKKKRLEISADGVIELFEIIKKIVKLSPKFESWDIVAFRQPSPTPFCLEFQNMKFDTSKMKFLPYENEDKELNIAVFGDNFKEYDENSLFLYGLTTIDNLIGEYNCVMKIKGYDFVDKDEIGDNTVYPLEELQKYIDKYYEDKKSK